MATVFAPRPVSSTANSKVTARNSLIQHRYPGFLVAGSSKENPIVLDDTPHTTRPVQPPNKLGQIKEEPSIPRLLAYPRATAPTPGQSASTAAAPAAAHTAAPTTAPATVAPATVAPATVAPTTVAPATVAPTTVAPTTVAPTTVAPTTVAPTTVALAPGNALGVPSSAHELTGTLISKPLVQEPRSSVNHASAYKTDAGKDIFDEYEKMFGPIQKQKRLKKSAQGNSDSAKASRLHIDSTEGPATASTTDSQAGLPNPPGDDEEHEFKAILEKWKDWFLLDWGVPWEPSWVHRIDVSAERVAFFESEWKGYHKVKVLYTQRRHGKMWYRVRFMFWPGRCGTCWVPEKDMHPIMRVKLRRGARGRRCGKKSVAV